MEGLFSEIKEKRATSEPLAYRMRPTNLADFVGQLHLVGKDGPIKRMLDSKAICSMILWGPPGVGKTTLANVIAKTFDLPFISFSAVTSGVKEIREVITRAKSFEQHYKKQTILFVDEIHHFNKSQQDSFLPHIERGTIVLIGATTENPSFELISPLLSRLVVYTLNPISEPDITRILKEALTNKERGLGKLEPIISPETLDYISSVSTGDARVALNILEMMVLSSKPDQNGKIIVELSDVKEGLRKRALLYDKAGEEHYNIISAFIKSMRGSDTDASLYWLCRMLASGEDPLFLARRMVRFASEDIGNADPTALQIALAAKDAFDFLGSPEGELALAHAAIYLAYAPKSNSIYLAYENAKRSVEESGSLPTPLHLRNAPTRLMKKLGYGKGYLYPHDFPSALVYQEYLPEGLKGKRFYYPSKEGLEKEISERMEKITKALRKEK